MMSIDVGIKNLSFVVVVPKGCNEGDRQPATGSAELEIMLDETGAPLWSIIDITPDEYDYTCDFIGRLKKRCGKQSVCKYATQDSSFCATHKKHADPEIACVHFDRNKAPLNDVYATMVNKLDAFFQKHSRATEKIDTVIIEKQPPNNPRMRAIMNVLHSYFVIRGKVDHLNGLCLKDIHLIDAKHKLTVYKGPPVDATHFKKKYDQRKFLSVAYTRQLLQGAVGVRQYFEDAGAKKDDLADCFLQAIYSLIR